MKFTRKDLVFCVLTGALSGFAIWQIAEKLGLLADGKFAWAVQYLPWLVLILPAFWILGVNLGYFLGLWMPFFNQFGKFAAVGFTNTAIDFAVLNLLSAATGITSGGQIILLNMASFGTATICSYFFNKHWVFGDNTFSDESQKFVLFLTVSLIGIAINTGIVYLFTTFIPPVLGLEKSLWLNLGKVLATGASLVWNFLGYKLFVFKK